MDDKYDMLFFGFVMFLLGYIFDSIEVICRDDEGKVSHHQDVSAWLSKEYKKG